jgi:hypothetical protein
VNPYDLPKKGGRFPNPIHNPPLHHAWAIRGAGGGSITQLKPPRHLGVRLGMGARKKWKNMPITWNISIFNNLGENKEKHDIQQLEHILFEMETHENKKLTASARSIFQKKELFLVDEPGFWMFNEGQNSSCSTKLGVESSEICWFEPVANLDPLDVRTKP